MIDIDPFAIDKQDTIDKTQAIAVVNPRATEFIPEKGKEGW
jgi:hypothetical protein